MFDATQIIDKICPVCGKNFVPAGQHMYKDARTNSLVCSWTCMLKSERLKEAQSSELKYMAERIAVTKKALTTAKAKTKFNLNEIHKLQERLAVEENIYNIIHEYEEAAAIDDEDIEEDD